MKVQATPSPTLLCWSKWYMPQDENRLCGVQWETLSWTHQLRDEIRQACLLNYVLLIYLGIWGCGKIQTAIDLTQKATIAPGVFSLLYAHWRRSPNLFTSSGLVCCTWCTDGSSLETNKMLSPHQEELESTIVHIQWASLENCSASFVFGVGGVF